MSLGRCDPEQRSFTTTIDNPFFPLPVGHELVLEGMEGSSEVLVRITVLDELEDVGGVTTRVVEEHEEADGRVIETSLNYFAQTADGTVCYFGEAVDMYDAAGNVTSHEGSWRADEGDNRAGIFMPSELEVGQRFQQEVAPGIAEDHARVAALDVVTEVPAGTFRDTATMFDSSPFDNTETEKVYAEGIGLVVDGPVRLTSFTRGDE